MKNPLARALAVVLSLAVPAAPVLAEAPKDVNGAGIQDLSSARGNGNLTFDRNRQTGAAGDTTVQAGDSSQKNLPATQPAAQPKLDTGGGPPNGGFSGDDSKISGGDKKESPMTGLLSPGSLATIACSATLGIVGAVMFGPFGLGVGLLAGLILGYVVNKFIGGGGSKKK